MTSKHISDHKYSFTGTVIVGTALSIILTVLLIMILSILIASNIVGEISSSFIIHAIMFTAIIIAALFSSRKATGKIAFIHSAQAIIYLLLLISVNIVFFDGTFKDLWLGTTIVFTAAFISTLISIKLAGKQRKQKIQKRQFVHFTQRSK